MQSPALGADENQDEESLSAATNLPCSSRPERLEGLPPFPTVARKLMEIVSHENCPMQEVSRLIRTDASFAAEVLRLANSALFGLRFEVVSILHAISVLGMDRLKALVLTVGMRDFMAGASHVPQLHRCWRHNLAAAVTAEWLAEFHWLDKSVCYTAGLLHDLGRLALMALYPERYQELIQQVEAGGGCIRAYEKLAFGMDSSDAGIWVAEDWRLPPLLREVVCTHGAPLKPHAEPDVINVAALSCHLADVLGFPVCGRPPEWNHETLRSSLRPETWERIQSRLPELLHTVPFKINVFDCEFL